MIGFRQIRTRQPGSMLGLEPQHMADGKQKGRRVAINYSLYSKAARPSGQ